MAYADYLSVGHDPLMLGVSVVHHRSLGTSLSNICVCMLLPLVSVALLSYLLLHLSPYLLVSAA